MDLRYSLPPDGDDRLPHSDALTVGELDVFHNAITSRLAEAGIVVEDDGWFSSGFDQQHQDHLDERGHTEDDTDEAIAEACDE